MARLNITVGDIASIDKAVTMAIIDVLVKKLPPRIYEICQWYKEEVASFKHVYNDVYENVKERLGPIILAEEPNIEIEIHDGGARIKVRMFDDSPGGSLDKQTPTGIVHGKSKKNIPYANLGWWRFFEYGEAFGGNPGRIRSWGSNDFGFVRTGENEGIMAPLGSFVVTRSGKRVIVKKRHPGVLTIGFFEKTWLDMRDEFSRRLLNAIKEVLR